MPFETEDLKRFVGISQYNPISVFKNGIPKNFLIDFTKAKLSLIMAEPLKSLAFKNQVETALNM